MKKTIAVVDDDRPILDVMSMILREEGYDVVPYESGEELLNCEELEKLNLILLDYRLPRQNGAQIATYLKSDKSTKDIPVILISANHNLEKQLEKAPIDDFIPKPFEIATLMEKVNTYLRLHD